MRLVVVGTSGTGGNRQLLEGQTIRARHISAPNARHPKADRSPSPHTPKSRDGDISRFGYPGLADPASRVLPRGLLFERRSHERNPENSTRRSHPFVGNSIKAKYAPNRCVDATRRIATLFPAVLTKSSPTKNIPLTTTSQGGTYPRKETRHLFAPA